MFAALPLSWKLLGAALVVILLGAIYVKGRADGAEKCQAEQAIAQQKAQKKADALADELVIAQAASMAVTEKKVVSYVDRIKTVQAPDTACAADQRMRIGSEGVRDLILGGGVK